MFRNERLAVDKGELNEKDVFFREKSHTFPQDGCENVESSVKQSTQPV